MSQHSIHTQATHIAIQRTIRGVPGKARGGSEVAEAMMIRAALALLGRIKQAFIVKARGGTDEAGDRWVPLSPKTIAYSRTRSRGTGGRTPTERARDARPSRALSNAQQERWWQLYRQGLAIYHGREGAQASAARRAWHILKGEGATTLLERHGNRQVEILRDTGLLLNSLSPGSGSVDQVLRVGRGEVTIGTNRKWAATHHHGVPGRIPQRRLWPPPSGWPDTWWRDILEQIQAGLVDLITQSVRSTK